MLLLNQEKESTSLFECLLRFLTKDFTAKTALLQPLPGRNSHCAPHGLQILVVEFMNLCFSLFWCEFPSQAGLVLRVIGALLFMLLAAFRISSFVGG